jgi:hypothetical protein
VRYLNALGMEIRIQIFPSPAGKKRAGMSVELLGAGGNGLPRAARGRAKSGAQALGRKRTARHQPQ